MKHILSMLIITIVISACGSNENVYPKIDRLTAIPSDAVKMTPDTDLHPPAAGPGWSQPTLMEGPINTAGAEDGPFLTADGKTFYFFFTPDVRIPAEQQVSDNVTGLYMSQWTGSGWDTPVRIWLTKPGQPSLDGCEFVQGNTMWFCTVRAGNTNEIDWYTAQWVDGKWSNWQEANDYLNSPNQVGELYITPDGQELYFGSKRPEGFGGFDLWVSRMTPNGWGEPVNLGPEVNTAEDENRPFVTLDGQELWYDSRYSVYRCIRQSDDSWADCQQIISPLAGEPTLSPDGETLYFIHHYLDVNSQIIEADVYESQRLSPQ
jgi:hypothetical protein